jgi:hypothetical protein
MNEQEGGPTMTDDRFPHDSRTDPIPSRAPVPPPAFSAAPPPPSPVPVRRRGGPAMMSIVLGVAVLFAIGGVAFAAGRLTAPAAATAAGNGGFGAGRGAGNGGGNGAGNAGNGAGNGFGFGNGGAALGATGLSIKGTVTAVAADQLTLQLPGGQTVDVPIDSSTTFHRQSGAARTDVTSGATVEIALSGRFGRGTGPNAGGNGGAAASPAPSGATGAGRALGPATDVTITGG